ncbi:MAG: lytic transglycosylase domain-containing protein [Bacteroidetes bacterium]|nr:lytic transglycosylase domain-containing protein [Bacteroidota bacterium]MCK5764799.1 lytic transglycosylase domain-containing protein [Bacteroidales bacterium]
MVKRIFFFVLISVLCLSAAGLFYFFSGDDGVSDKQYRDAFRRNYKIFAVDIPKEISFSGESVPLNVFYVRESLDRELLVNTYWHNKTVLLFKRAHRWFPVIEPILSEYGIPDDFKYLAVIESGLSNAVSPSGAVGFWQFLKGTAKDYGLEVDKDVDERYHVQKSTEAACRYFRDSYQKFGDWTLVAAAYNAGKRRITESLEEQAEDSYYDLLLSEETGRYVFRILALKTIFDNPTQYGFFLREKDFYPPIPVKTVKVDKDIKNFVAFAKEHDISYKVLKMFNPWLRDKKLNVKRGKTYLISIPEDDYTNYEDLIDDMSGDPIVFRDTLNFEEL